MSVGRRKLAEKYLETKLVAFRFEGNIDPDPSQAPLVAHHPMRDVIAALEDEVFSFRPELIFPFLRDCLARFPGRLPREDAYPGPLLDEEYGAKVQGAIAMLVEHVVMERPEEPFQWLDEWLVGQLGGNGGFGPGGESTQHDWRHYLTSIFFSVLCETLWKMAHSLSRVNSPPPY